VWHSLYVFQYHIKMTWRAFHSGRPRPSITPSADYDVTVCFNCTNAPGGCLRSPRTWSPWLNSRPVWDIINIARRGVFDVKRWLLVSTVWNSWLIQCWVSSHVQFHSPQPLISKFKVELTYIQTNMARLTGMINTYIILKSFPLKSTKSILKFPNTNITQLYVLQMIY
jgi:hypothetical protein